MAWAAATLPEFAHIKPSRILVVAGEARRASRATAKPLRFAGGLRTDISGRTRPLVRIEGVSMLYTITLRPLFFRRSTPRERVATVLHELFHLSHDFDGTLDHKRRHSEAKEGFEREFTPIERRAFRKIPPHVLAPFAFDGEVRVNQWLEKPQSYLPSAKLSCRSRYTEAQLFEGIVRMKTRPRVAASALLQ